MKRNIILKKIKKIKKERNNKGHLGLENLDNRRLRNYLGLLKRGREFRNIKAGDLDLY